MIKLNNLLGDGAYLHNLIVQVFKVNDLVSLFVKKSDQSELIFNFFTDDGEEVNLHAKTKADCCSETWFADITNIQALKKGVIHFRELEAQKLGEDARSRQDYDTLYGFQIITVGGHVDFAYRNSSNGYYGGQCEFFVSHDTIDESKYTDILSLDDWSS